MKKGKLLTLLSLIVYYSFGQTTNTFPSTGPAGIGTTSPSGLLEILGNTSDKRLVIGPDASHAHHIVSYRDLVLNSYNGFIFRKSSTAGSVTNYSDLFIIASNGNIGVGTTTPSSFGTSQPTLDLRGKSVYRTGSIMAFSSDLTRGWSLGRADDSSLPDGLVISTTDTAPINFKTGNIISATFAASGHLGIGTTNPGSALSVVSSNSDVLHISKSTSNADDNIYLAFSHANNTASNNIRARIGTNIKPGGYGRLTFHTGSLGNTPERLRIDENGNVGIGVTNPDFKLVVDGKIRCEEVKVEIVNGPDYVFEENYELPTLEETKAYITENKHLPEIPSAKEMEVNGIDLGDMNMKLLKKVEELTLYLIEQNKQNQAQQAEIEVLKAKMDQLENQ